MRRFFTFVFLTLLSLPVGMSIAGCGKHNNAVFCNGGDSGPILGQVASIDLEPKIYGISLNYGAEGQLSSPRAVDCKGNSVGIAHYSYGTTNQLIADVSPTGSICAGSWNRSSPAGIADYTTCTPPSTATINACFAANASTNPGACVAYLSASGGGANSNLVPIYVHAPVTSIQLTNQADCVSQGDTLNLSTETKVYSGTGSNQQDITPSVGHLTYTPQDSSIVTIDQNGIATANNPGSTVITAAIAQASSSAGFFYTCPPAKITLSLPNSTSTSVTITPNTPQPVTATVTDTKGKTISGLDLEFVSTNPKTIAAGNGIITAYYPDTATITAICQPGTCNPAPIDQIGTYGTGKSVTSTPIYVTATGASSTILYIASTQSQYFVPVDFTQTTLGTPIRLPYVPNSMVIDDTGTSIYMGSASELMVVSAATNGLSREDPNVQGKVLAISPNGNTLILSDPNRKLIYLYNTTNSSFTVFGGTGTRAQFTPDSQTVYIAGTDWASNPTTGTPALFVYSTFSGWHTYDTSTGANDVAVTVPNVGAYVAGTVTTVHSYCPDTTVSPVSYYPQDPANTVSAPTDILAATNDGFHILGTTVSAGPALVDIALLGTQQTQSTACPTSTGLPLPSTFTTQPLAGIDAASMTGIVPSSDSSQAFITYTPGPGATATGTILPVYEPKTGSAGTLAQVTLATGATAPVAGVYSADGSSFYVGTSGDNQVHIINTKTLTDVKQLAPNLTDINGNVVVPNLIVDKPRSST
ncbi:MAG: hypothetical protein ACYC46_10145 [Acidobacteriaceae bacterium]